MKILVKLKGENNHSETKTTHYIMGDMQRERDCIVLYVSMLGITKLISANWIVLHTTYRQNNNHKKCAGIGLNGFIFKNINKKILYINVGMARGIPRPSILEVPDLFSLLDSPRNRFYNSSAPRVLAKIRRGPRNTEYRKIFSNLSRFFCFPFCFSG